MINNGVKGASVGSDFGEVEARLGERGSYRVSFDYNKSLLNERAAIRFAMVEADTQFQQTPAYEEVSRQYVALQGILAKNENVNWLSATTVRANYENGKVGGAPVNNIPLCNAIST